MRYVADIHPRANWFVLMVMPVDCALCGSNCKEAGEGYDQQERQQNKPSFPSEFFHLAPGGLSS
jgi:hypothetical protein